MEVKEQYTVEEIKLFFEHKPIQKRIDFIEEYDFNDDYLSYYQEFLIENKEESDIDYLVCLIELAEDLEIYNEFLLEKYIGYLKSKKSIYLKLTILDYFIDFPLEEKQKIGLEEPLKSQLKTQNIILKNQIFLNLIALKTIDCSKYKMQFFQSLLQTDDYKSLIRVVNNFLNHAVFFDVFTRKEIFELIKNLKAKKLGKALESSVLELEKVIFGNGMM